MNADRHPRAPGAVRWIVRTLEEAGFETWAVGGAVRDVLLGFESVDWDFATRARPGQVRRVFRRTVPIGLDHGTVGVLARDGTLYEVTTFRKDVETTGRHAVVEFADRLEDDLARRDFTINAIAWHPLRDELRDPFGGAEDLETGVLRTVGPAADRFAEDWLRVLRALRFAGRFGLEIEGATWSALQASAPRLVDLSPERVREELMKVLGQDPDPRRSLSLYAESGALGVLLPELDALGHEGTSDGRSPWELALETVSGIGRHRPLLRLAALLLDTGRSAEAVESRASERDRAARQAAALTTRLRFSNAEIDRVTALVRAGASLPAAADPPDRRRRWLARVGPERVRDVVRLAAARARVEVPDDPDGARAAGGGSVAEPEAVVAAWRELRAEMRARPPLSVGDLALDGRDLIRMGLRPGPRFGEILDGLLERVLDRPELNRADTLEDIVRSELASGSGEES